MRKRLEGVPHKNHEDHIAAKGINSLSRYNLVPKFIPMPQAWKFRDAKAAVEREWEKLEKIPAWQLTKVRNKKKVIEEARNHGKKVHFESLMDLCHLKNSELEPQFQKLQWQSRILRWHCKRWFWFVCSIYCTRIISISNDGRKGHGLEIEASRMFRTSSWCSIR